MTRWGGVKERENERGRNRIREKEGEREREREGERGRERERIEISGTLMSGYLLNSGLAIHTLEELCLRRECVSLVYGTRDREHFQALYIVVHRIRQVENTCIGRFVQLHSESYPLFETHRAIGDDHEARGSKTTVAQFPPTHIPLTQVQHNWRKF